MPNKDPMRGRIMPAYVECALWASTDENGSPLDDNYGADDVAPEALQRMRDDCASFFFETRRLLRQTRIGASPDMLPRHAHDFWLTRCRHGAGFWDRGYGDVGDKLTDAAHVYGNVDLYVGDDGRIYA